MKRMKDVVFAMLVFACLVSSISITKAKESTEIHTSHASHAHVHEETLQDDIQVRLPICGSCGIGTLAYVLHGKSSWTGNGQTSNCLHGKPYGTDKIFKRVVYRDLICSYCGESANANYYEYEYECHGYW